MLLLKLLVVWDCSILACVFVCLYIYIYIYIYIYCFLYGCEALSLTLREVRRLCVFENRVLRRIFGPKRDEVTVEWRRLHNKELYALYSPNIIQVIKSRRLR